jgi:hypothetical protein
MEAIMPDLQSELSKVINEWSHPMDNTQPETDTPQITHSEQPTQDEADRPMLKDFVFDTIKRNPGIHVGVLMDVGEANGYKRGSVEAVASKMVAQGYAKRQGRALTAIAQEIGPLKSSAYLKREAARLAKLEALKKARAVKAEKEAARKKRDERKHALMGKPLPAPVPEEATPELRVTMHEPHWDAEDMVNNLTLRQARALYEALHRVFGH